MEGVDYKEEAQKWLEFIRSGTKSYDDFLKYLREEVQKGGLTLQDIGTSEKELEQLRVNGCKTSAQEWLEFLRSGTEYYDSFLKYLREEVQKGGLTLQDIGTSEKELEQLRLKGCKISAQKRLKSLRSGTEFYSHFLKYLREEVQKGGLTLQDIGTSEKELEQLRVKGCKTSAQKWLKSLRSGTKFYDDFLKYLREEVQKGGLTLQDIGTSEKELENTRPAKR